MSGRCILPALAFAALSGCASFYTGGPITKAAGAITIPAARHEHRGEFGAADAALLAVQNSAELRAERLLLDARSASWRLGLRAYLPQLDLSFGTDERIALYAGDSFSKNLSLSLVQTVWDGGRLSVSRAIESADLDMARWSLERKTRDIGDSAITAFRAVAAARARLALRRDSLDRAREDLALMVTELALGRIVQSDVKTAELRLMGLDIELAQALLDLQNKEAALALLLGLEALPESLAPLRLNEPVLVVDEGLALKLAVECSPELAAARITIIKKRAEARAAAFVWLPTIGLSASATASGSNWPLHRLSWSLGLKADFSGPLARGRAGINFGGEPPYDRSAALSGNLAAIPEPSLLASLGQAKTAYELEKELYAHKVGELERGVRAACAVYRARARQRELGQRALALAEQAYGLVALRLELGQALSSELLASGLERTKRALDLVDAAEALDASQRNLERFLDAAPGSLAALFGTDQRGES